MALRIVVEGQGTIETALNWQSTAILNGSGSYSFTMPASDPAAAWLTPLARVYCYWDTTLIGAGAVEALEVNGNFLSVSGGDLANELLYKAIRYANSTYAETIANDLGALVPSGWAYVDAVTGATNIVSLNVMWDSLQNAINTLCEMAGLWWHVVGNTLTIANAYGPLVAGLTALSITRRIDASNMVGIIFPFGAGDGMAALTAQAANLTLSPPYSYYQSTMGCMTAYGVGRTDAPGYPVTARRKRMDFKQISPPANTDAGIIAAANTLITAAVEELRRNGTPIVEYDVEAAWPGLVRPLDRVALVYNDASLKVSETLVATEVTTVVTPDTLATVRMRLEASARRILSDNEVIADALIAGRITPTYPQLGAYDDTVTETVRIDNTKGLTTEGTVAYSWPPFTTQVFLVTAARTITQIPLSEGGLNSGAPVPTAVEYRLNGTGSWATFPATLNLTAALVNATTLHQVADSFTINVRGVLRTNYRAATSTPEASIPAIPNGTGVRLQAIGDVGTDSGIAKLSTLYSAPFGTILATIPENGWVTVTGGPTKSPTTGTNRPLWYPVTYRGQPGYVVLYILNATNANSGNEIFNSVDYASDVAVSLQTRLVGQSI